MNRNNEINNNNCDDMFYVLSVETRIPEDLIMRYVSEFNIPIIRKDVNSYFWLNKYDEAKLNGHFACKYKPFDVIRTETGFDIEVLHNNGRIIVNKYPDLDNYEHCFYSTNKEYVVRFLGCKYSFVVSQKQLDCKRINDNSTVFPIDYDERYYEINEFDKYELKDIYNNKRRSNLFGLKKYTPSGLWATCIDSAGDNRYFEFEDGEIVKVYKTTANPVHPIFNKKKYPFNYKGFKVIKKDILLNNCKQYYQVLRPDGKQDVMTPQQMLEYQDRGVYNG